VPTCSSLVSLTTACRFNSDLGVYEIEPVFVALQFGTISAVSVEQQLCLLQILALQHLPSDSSQLIGSFAVAS
jgi:hypothetical protein